MWQGGAHALPHFFALYAANGNTKDFFSFFVVYFS